MRHYKRGRKLGSDASHTKAMKKSLVNALFLNDRIKTVEARAKEVRGDIDKIITWAKRGDLHSRRLAIAALGDKELVREIFEKVEQGMFAGRNGGYTRIMKLGTRKGDNAPIVILELVTEELVKKEAAKAPAKKGKAVAKKTVKKEKAVDETVKAEDDAVVASEEAAASDAVEEKADQPSEVAEEAATEEVSPEAVDEQAEDKVEEAEEKQTK